LRIDPTTLLANAVTTSERPSGEFTLATGLRGTLAPYASTWRRSRSCGEARPVRIDAKSLVVASSAFFILASVSR